MKNILPYSINTKKNRFIKVLSKKNTKLIPREFIQNHGIHFDLVLRKLSFGADYITDFFYMSKSSDDWHLVFVEIEKPQSRFFRDGSNDLHPDFQSALQQIGRWRAWLSNSANFAAFLASLAPMRRPINMTQNPSYPRFVLVHGRREEYGANEQRRAIVHAEEREDFHILSFDSLAEGLTQKHECYIGARHNETIEIFGDELVSPEMYMSIEPSQFLVSSALQEAIRQGPTFIYRRVNGSTVQALSWVADHIRVK